MRDILCAVDIKPDCFLRQKNFFNWWSILSDFLQSGTFVLLWYLSLTSKAGANNLCNHWLSERDILPRKFIYCRPLFTKLNRVHSTMKNGPIFVVLFLLLLVLSSLVQKSVGLTGILIPRRVPKCRSSRSRRRRCRGGQMKTLVPIFVVTESQIKKRNFLR